MKLFAFTPEIFNLNSWKCGSCNWEVTTLYWLADSYHQARSEIKQLISSKNGAPLCGDCMCSLLSEQKYNINK